jgi:subtilisin family serine protease
MGKIGILLLTAVLGFQAQAARYIVKYKDPARFRQVSAQLKSQNSFWKQWNLSPVRQNIQFLQNEKVEVTEAFDQLELAVIDGDFSEAELRELKNNPQVAYIEEESFLPAPAPVPPAAASAVPVPYSPAWAEPWGIKDIKAPEAWPLAKSGEGVRVMILDTGIDRDHPAIKNNFEEGRDFVNDGSLAPYPFYDQIGHGTFIAGVVAADGLSAGLSGVAPKARILMGRVCGGFNSECPSTAILAGVDWAIAKKVQVLNISLGGPFPSMGAQEAYARAEAAGVVVVSASGNYGVHKLSYPAAYPEVLSVGAMDRAHMKPDFSNWSDELDVAAPGVDVFSSFPAGKGNSSEVFWDEAGAEVQISSMAFEGSLVSDKAVTAEVVYAGLGEEKDFEDLDASGKIVLIRRGQIPFGDKARNAVAAGAAGVLIFNDQDELYYTTLNGQLNLPVIMIEKQKGEELLARLQAGLGPVTVSLADHPSSYMFLSGTSMASPHVAGVVALVRAANPNLSPKEVREVIRDTARAETSNLDHQLGQGSVNAEEAVKAAVSLRPAVISGISGMMENSPPH